MLFLVTKWEALLVMPAAAGGWERKLLLPPRSNAQQTGETLMKNLAERSKKVLGNICRRD